MEKQIIDIDGIKTEILMEGQGRPLIMLHGWGGSKESWIPLIEQLEKLHGLNERSYIAIDLPGFGNSDNPDKEWRVLDYTKFAEKAIKKILNIIKWMEGYDLMIHSFGGRIALKMFSLENKDLLIEKPDKLVLIAAAGIKPKDKIRVKFAKLISKTGKKIFYLPILKWIAPFTRKIIYKLVRAHDYAQAKGVMKGTFVQVINEDLRDAVVLIDKPTLIIWGKKDSYVPYFDALYMHHIIKESKLITFNDGKHGIHKTHASEIAKQLKLFL